MKNTDPLERQVPIDEARRRYQNIEHVVSELKEHQWNWLGAPTGAGKSFMVDRLLSFQALYDHFDRVVYMAPSWNIIEERTFAKSPDDVPVSVAVIKGRPRERCGDLNERWMLLETTGSIEYGRQSLCGKCVRNRDDDRCPWSMTFAGRVGDARLLGFPEQVISQNPTILMYLMRGRTLVVADEPQLALNSFKVEITKSQLKMFKEVVSQVQEIPTAVKERWMCFLDSLTAYHIGRLQDAVMDAPPSLDKYSAMIQERGVQRHGGKFQYLGYHIANLKRARRDEMSIDDAGTITFLARPYLNVTLLLMSAHVTKKFLEHRLRIENIHELFADVRVKIHAGTRIVNLKASSGSKFALKPNKRGVSSADYLLPLFAAMIVRNIERGYSTLLVSSKDLKATFAARLTKLVANVGYQVAILTDDHDKDISEPTLLRIPVIHYGTMGVNNYKNYRTCICMNSYYVSDDTLLQMFFDGLSYERIPSVGRERIRGNRVWPESADLWGGRREVLREYADVYEKGVVVQAAGRVRPFEYPREIFLFEGHDFSREFGECYEEVATVPELYKALGMLNYNDLCTKKEVRTIKNMLLTGMKQKDVASELEVTASHVSRLIKWAKETGFYEQL